MNVPINLYVVYLVGNNINTEKSKIKKNKKKDTNDI